MTISRFNIRIFTRWGKIYSISEFIEGYSIPQNHFVPIHDYLFK
jgi:hypothetical protein